MSTMTADTATLDLVCECCAIALVNDDTSGCAGNCPDRHVETLGRYAGHPETARVVYLDTEGPTHHGPFTCAGCGQDSPHDYAGHVEITDHP